MKIRWRFAIPILGLALFGFVTYQSVSRAKGHTDRYFYWSSIRLDLRPSQVSKPCNLYAADCADWDFFIDVRPSLLARSLMLSGLPAFLVSFLITSGSRRLGVSELTSFFYSVPVLLLAWYYLLGRLFEYWSARNLLTRHSPLVIGTYSLFFAVYVGSEAIRAVAVVISILLMLYQYLVYRKTSSGSRLLFVSLFPAEIGLISVRLALNMTRFYTYDPETAITWAWHERLIRIQEYLAWTIAALAAVVLTWTLFRFAHWLLERTLRKHAPASS
jgi:hypothetical protein